MNSPLQILGGVAGLTLLYYGAEWLVKGGSAIAVRCKVPPLIIGLTLVAFGTSAPELFVSLDAALAGKGDIAVGNVVGSNICNILLILGLSALISPLGVNKVLFRRDVPLMILSSLFITVLCFIQGGIGRVAGMILFTGIVIYTVVGIIEGRHEVSQDAPPEVSISKVMSVVAVVAGLGALVLGARLLIKAAIFMATSLGVPDSVIALTVVAIGTSLPELATSVVAAIKGEADIAIGNVVGSNIFNILCILGLSSIVSPIQCVGIDAVDFIVMTLTAVVLWPIMKTGLRISRIEGVFLLLTYAAYTTWLIYKL
jgi:cation:H+ antiporter